MEALWSIIALWLFGRYYEHWNHQRNKDKPLKQMNVETIRDPTAFGRTSHGLDPDHGVKDMENFGFTYGDPDFYVWKRPDPRREHQEFDISNWPKLFPKFPSAVPANYNVFPETTF